MLRLKATLVAMMPTRPWRTGWSMERGVDFSLAEAIRPSGAARSTVAAAEPVCFIDDEQATRPDAALARGFDRQATDFGSGGSLSGDGPEAAGLRAWWSLASKSSWT